MPKRFLSQLERGRIQDEIVKPLFFTSLPILFIRALSPRKRQKST
jgi:hypothetical protein